jgi:type IV pilus assembly protein PilC
MGLWFKKTRQRVLLYRQVSLLLRTGCSLAEALAAVADFPARWIKRSLEQMQRMLADHRPVAEVISKHPELFPRFPLGLLQKDLAPPTLGRIFFGLAEQMEKVSEMKRRMIQAVAYPLLICAVALLLFLFLMIFVMPIFTEMYRDFGQDLPVLTRLVIDVGDMARKSALPILVAIVALVVLLTQNPAWGVALGIRFPGFGAIVRKVSIYLLARNLATYLTSGVALGDAVNQAVANLRHFSALRPLARLSDAATTPADLMKQLEANRYFPRILVQMTGVGDRGGDLGEALHEFSLFYEKEIESDYFRLVIVTQVLALLLVVALIGTTVIGMYLPIFNMSGALF